VARSRAASFGPHPLDYPAAAQRLALCESTGAIWLLGATSLAIGKGLTSRAFSESQRPLAKKAGKTGLLTNDLIESLALEYDQPFPLLLCQPIYRVDSPRIWELATISLIAKKVRKLV
jgi:hypothetical protein